MKLPALFAILFIPLLSHAQTVDRMNLNAGTLGLAIQCNFRVTTKFTCDALVADIYAFYNTIVHRENSASDALITLSLTDEAGSSGNVNYTYTWSSKEETEAAGPIYSLILNHDAMDDLQLKSILSTNVATGIQFYSTILSVAVENGSMSVTSQPHGGGTAEGSTFMDRFSKSPFYVNVGLSGSYRAQGNKPYDSKTISGTATPEFVYSTDRYKVDIDGYYYNQSSSVPNGTGYTQSSVVEKGLSTVAIYSLSDQKTGNLRKWSVAVFNRVGSDPNSNINQSTATGGGIEYAAVPFRTTENKELSFRVGGNYNTLKLGQPNILENLSERYTTVFAKVYFYWVLKESKFSITASARIDRNLKYSGFDKFSGNGTLSYKINNATRINGSINYSYTSKSLTYPVAPDLSNALQVSQMGGLAGQSVYLQLGLDFTIGNINRRTRDRRWAE